MFHSNNMLYPKEDRAHRVLLFACRNCDHQEEATQHCVYRNNIIAQPIERTHAVAGLAADPTLPRTSKRPCPKCAFQDVVFFQSHDRRRDTPMTLYFVCGSSSCGHLWTDEQLASKRP